MNSVYEMINTDINTDIHTDIKPASTGACWRLLKSNKPNGYRQENLFSCSLGIGDAWSVRVISSPLLNFSCPRRVLAQSSKPEETL